MLCSVGPVFSSNAECCMAWNNSVLGGWYWNFFHPIQRIFVPFFFLNPRNSKDGKNSVKLLGIIWVPHSFPFVIAQTTLTFIWNQCTLLVGTVCTATKTDSGCRRWIWRRSTIWSWSCTKHTSKSSTTAVFSISMVFTFKNMSSVSTLSEYSPWLHPNSDIYGVSGVCFDTESNLKTHGVPPCATLQARHSTEKKRVKYGIDYKSGVACGAPLDHTDGNNLQLARVYCCICNFDRFAFKKKITGAFHILYVNMSSNIAGRSVF